jgi:succinate dehydrogenase / fumarate reductase iron-sulfur subunit
VKITFKVWRQASRTAAGEFKNYALDDVPASASLLEGLDILNNQLEAKGEQPVAFDSDCREGICGSCGMMVDGLPHGPGKGTTTCQLYMRNFPDGGTITLEPFRASAFPVIKDLMVDRSAFDRIIQQGGYVSVNTGAAPDANSLPIAKDNAELAFLAAQCIGCGACVASCKNASASLFVSAKVSHLALLPQGDPERKKRVIAMVEKMDEEGFGGCTNEMECEAACPKQISVSHIARLNRELLRAKLFPSA